MGLGQADRVFVAAFLSWNATIERSMKQKAFDQVRNADKADFSTARSKKENARKSFAARRKEKVSKGDLCVVRDRWR